jgi:hypothetical protein
MPLRAYFFWVGILLIAGTAQVQAILFDGSVRSTNFRAGNCNISETEVQFSIDEAFGEPLLTSSLNWQAGAKTSTNCLPEKSSIWIELQGDNRDPYFVLFNPKIGASGTSGQETTSSPDWNRLLCSTIGDSAICLPEEAAKQIIQENPVARSLQIISETQIAILDQPSSTDEQPKTNKTARFNLNFEQQLLDTIDNALSSSEDNQPVEPVKKQPVNSPSDLVQDKKAPPAQSVARTNVPKNIQGVSDHIANLMSKDLAVYSAQAGPCSSDKSVKHTLQSETICGLNFTSRTTFKFLCADNQIPQPVSSNHSIWLDLAEDNISKPLIRISEEGWASLLLSKANSSPGVVADPKSSSQFLVSGQNNKIEALSSLARQLIVLQNYCSSARS